MLSQEMVYIGQSSDLAKRISQHTVGKDWWESVVILTTKDDSLNHSDIDYLETVLIEKAKKNNRLDCDNKKKGNDPKVDKFRKVILEQYLEEAMFLMQLIGINVFNQSQTTVSKKTTTALINTMSVETKLAIGKRAKSEAIQYLANKGVNIGKNVSYAVKQGNKDEFWANPDVNLLKQEWDIILNNNVAMELYVLKVPANTFCLQDQTHKGLIVRSDNPKRIDLNIDLLTMKDRRTGIDFMPYVIKCIKY